MNSDWLLKFKGTKIRHYISGFIMVMAIFWIFSYIYILRSDAYAFAKEYISNNPKVIENIGSVKSVRPSYFNSSKKYANGIATAKIQIVLKGSVKSAVAYLNLSNSGNIWVVQVGSLLMDDGTSISLVP